MRDPEQNFLDLLGADVGIELSQRSFVRERTIRATQPACSPVRIAESLFGESADSAESHQSIRLLRKESVLYFSPCEGPTRNREQERDLVGSEPISDVQRIERAIP